MNVESKAPLSGLLKVGVPPVQDTDTAWLVRLEVWLTVTWRLLNCPRPATVTWEGVAGRPPTMPWQPAVGSACEHPLTMLSAGVEALPWVAGTITARASAATAATMTAARPRRPDGPRPRKPMAPPRARARARAPDSNGPGTVISSSCPADGRGGRRARGSGR